MVKHTKMYCVANFARFVALRAGLTRNGSVAKFRHGRRTFATLPYPQASSGLGFESFTDDCDGLRERTGTNAESALDDARLAADVLREVEDRRLALA